MVGWDDFYVGILTDVLGAIVVAVPIYLLFTRKEKQKENAVETNVLERLNRSLRM